MGSVRHEIFGRPAFERKTFVVATPDVRKFSICNRLISSADTGGEKQALK